MRLRSEKAPNVLALAWAFAAALFLLLPVPTLLEDLADAAPGTLPFDKLVHLTLFLLLTRAWLKAGRAPRAGGPGGRSAGLWVVAAAIAYGGLLEIAQGWVGERSGEWLDLAADAVGASLAPWTLRRLPSRWL